MFGKPHSRSPIPDRFRGKTALVTGGSCGIGRAIALELLREGASVAITTLPRDEAEGQLAFQEAGFSPLILSGDMGDEDFCRSVAVEISDRLGGVHFLVNNAFSFIARGMDGARHEFERSLAVGPLAFITMSQLAVESMRAHGGGAIVHVSSISGVIAQPNRWSYNGAKGMVNQLTKCMALDLAPWNIRVNSVSPGWICTRENEKAASDDASFITGADLPVDGGYQSLGPEGIGLRTVVAGTAD